jgi:hypothetical protein
LARQDVAFPGIRQPSGRSSPRWCWY